MNKLFKNFLKNTFITLGGSELLRLHNKSPRVLFWHGVDIVKYPEIEPENVDVRVFIQQIKYLKRHFNIISINEFQNHYFDKSLGKNDLVLTFDDGYKNNLTVLAPIMNDFSLPFTTFITTNNISSGDFFIRTLIRLVSLGSSIKTIDIPSSKLKFNLVSSEQKIEALNKISEIVTKVPLLDVQHIYHDLISNLPKDEYHEMKSKYSSLLPLTWEDTKQLQSAGCTIGSHCLDHICCHANQLEREVERQIIESKNVIESELGIECKYFAYPNGDFTDFSNKCVSKAGYTFGFSTQKKKLGSPEENIESLPRFVSYGSINTFKILLNYYRGS